MSVTRRLIGYDYNSRKYHHRKPVLYTVLTVPEEIRARFYSDHNEWRKVRKKLWYVLKNYFKIEMNFDELDKKIEEMKNIFESFKKQADYFMKGAREDKGPDSYFR